MANANKPLGFKPVRYRDGRPYVGQANTYYIPASDAVAVAVGDIVELAGSADASAEYGTVQRINAVTDRPLGVVTGIAFDPDDLSLSTYRPAATARYVLVADSPDLLLEAQTDGTPAANDIGLNVSPILGAGTDVISGTSSMQVDESTAATTNTLMLHLEGLVPSSDNSLDANAQVLVSFNNHQFKGANNVGQPGV